MIDAFASYVINSEAQKKLYKTMKNRPDQNSEPRDLGREWHSDSTTVPICRVPYCTDIS